jgi:hypothetical protein
MSIQTAFAGKLDKSVGWDFRRTVSSGVYIESIEDSRKRVAH